MLSQSIQLRSLKHNIGPDEDVRNLNRGYCDTLDYVNCKNALWIGVKSPTLNSLVKLSYSKNYQRAPIVISPLGLSCKYD